MNTKREKLLARIAELENELAHDPFSTACLELRDVIGRLRSLENAGNSDPNRNLGDDFNHGKNNS